MLFFAQYASKAAPGRFTSLFLASFELSKSQVGLVMAIPIALSLISVAVAGVIADKIPNGKIKVALACNIVGCLGFQMLAIPVVSNSAIGFLYICVMYALYRLTRGPAIVSLDAYALDYLEKHGNVTSKKNFGRKRMWGAISLGGTSVVIGIFLDRYGFSSLFAINLVTTSILVLLLSWEYLPCVKAHEPKFVRLEMKEKDTIVESGGPGEHAEEDDLEGDVAKTATAENGENENNTSTESAPGANKAQPTTKRGQEGVLEFCRVLLRNPRTVVFLFTVACSRVGTAFVENLVFLYFAQELKASNFMCGIAVVVTVS